MGNATTTKKAEAKPKAKRTVLTDAERIAKVEADLAALRAKAAAKAKGKVTQLSERLAKLKAGRDELDKKITALEAEIKAASELAGTDEAPTDDSPEDSAA